MVEGHVQSGAVHDLLCPSTTLRVVPLPLRGRIAIGWCQSNTDQPAA